jgi:uncharacterized cupin superfamily protein|tara:strand:- start:2015 stop:2293 length:279 start_codon:yes stop_codon:yes gene_type:complete
MSMSEITVKYLSEKEILEKEVRSWPTWSCEASEFPWEYIEQESCYILEGQVDITTIDGKIVSIGPGDFVVFPRGLKCTWKVRQAVYKHFSFG